MPNKVKNWKIWCKFEFFAFFGMELKKSAKDRKKWENKTSDKMFKSKKQFKIDF